VPRTAQSQISFADWELLQQGLSLEPFLQTISDFLEDHQEMIEAVRRDLERGLRNPETGRNGLTPSQVLHSQRVMSMKVRL
jgi:IS5 family transposase